MEKNDLFIQSPIKTITVPLGKTIVEGGKEPKYYSPIKKPLISQENFFSIVQEVLLGNLTSIVNYFNSLFHKQASNEQLQANIRSVVDKFEDDSNRTGLYYACYLGFTNIALYLLTLDADLFAEDVDKRNCFHILAYKGNLETLIIALNYLRYIELKTLYNNLQSKKQQYNIKNSYIKFGSLVTTIFHSKQTRANFEKFMEEIKNDFLNYFNKLLEDFFHIICSKDNFGRNVIHYAAQSSFTKCCLCLTTLLEIKFNTVPDFDTFFSFFQDIQALEFKESRKADPRKYQFVLEDLRKILDPKFYDSTINYFKKKVKYYILLAINQTDNQKYSPLQISSIAGDYSITEYLIRKGAKKEENNEEVNLNDPSVMAPNHVVRKVITSLNEESASSNIGKIKFLVSCGNSINDKKFIYSKAPIHEVIVSKDPNSEEALRTVHESGADLNILDCNGFSPLHYATMNGDYEKARYLLKNKANVNLFSNTRRTPLHIASLYNQSEIMDLLFEFHADLNAKSNENITPLMLASKKGFIDCIRKLLNLGASLYCVDIRNWTALHYAAQNLFPNAIRLLLYRDSDKNVLRNMKNSKGKTADQLTTDSKTRESFHNIWKAAKEGDLNRIRNFLKASENINSQTFIEKNTPLHIAIQNKQFFVTSLLLENGADVEIGNLNNQKPIDLLPKLEDEIHNLEIKRKKLKKNSYEEKENLKEISNAKATLEVFSKFLSKKKEQEEAERLNSLMAEPKIDNTSIIEEAKVIPSETQKIEEKSNSIINNN